VAHPLTGVRETFTLDTDRLLSAVRGPLYAPVLAAALPEAITEAAAGRFDALLGLSGALSGGRRGSVAMGMQFSVLCAEDGPRLSSQPPIDPAAPTGARSLATGPAGATPSTPFVDHGASLYQRVCAFWPRGAVPAAFYQVMPGSSATLLLSGGLDPATPPRHAARMARALGAKALQVVVPNAGHGLIGLGCVREVMFKFIDATDDAAALAVDASCVVGIPRPPVFAPVRPLASAAVAPVANPVAP
jgi:pimeloyl-ACP methyl ester carboxylesterase